MAYICTEFYTGTKNHKPFCRQNSIPAKSKMAAVTILKFFITTTTWLLLNIFAQNLAQSLETTSRKQFYLQISLLRKSKMAAAVSLKIGLKAISRTIWLIIAWSFANGLQTVSHNRFCCKNSHSAKSNMAAAAILKFTLTAIPVIIAYIRTNLVQHLKSISEQRAVRQRSDYKRLTIQ